MSFAGVNLYNYCTPAEEVDGEGDDTEILNDSILDNNPPGINSDLLLPVRQFTQEILPENVSTVEYLNRYWKNIEGQSGTEELDGDEDEAKVDAIKMNEEIYHRHPLVGLNDNEEEDYGGDEGDSVAEGSSGSLPLSVDEEEMESAGEFEFEESMFGPLLIQDISRLKAIDISGYGVKSVKNIGPMIPYVLRINASHNEINTFLDIETPPVALTEADFSHNQISTVRNLSSFWALTDIDLSYNDLTTMDGFSDLEFLQTLNLSHNKIETIKSINCQSLLILYLNSNLLKDVSGLEGCTTLKCINLNKNKISSLKGLRHMAALTDLYISDNNICDIFEFENLRPLLNLTNIRVEPGNPISTLDNWRLVLIHMLPQLLWVDGQRLEPAELRLAENTFNPSFRKIAFMDHSGILLDKACQAANSSFEVYCRTRPFPPLLLLVGPPRSHCHTLALLLKQKFKNKVFLGGVHSTATTMEGSHPHLDIPVSFESFVNMKNSGEFLATSHILGRVCGFSTSQIARAAEKGAVLVANVPLPIAISLREWNFQPKLVLIMSNSAPEFLENEQRMATINRNSRIEAEENRRKSSLRKSVDEDGTEILKNEESKDHHFVNFAETPSVVPSILKKERDPITIMDTMEDPEPAVTYNKHSILKPPHFENRPSVNFSSHTQMTRFDDAGSQTTIPLEKLSSKARITGDFHNEIDLENKRHRLRSLAPGMEKYHHDDDDDDNDTHPPIIEKSDLHETSSEIELKKSRSKGSAKIVGEFHDGLDLEKKSSRLKSLAPGKGKYDYFNDDDDDDDIHDLANSNVEEGKGKDIIYSHSISYNNMIKDKVNSVETVEEIDESVENDGENDLPIKDYISEENEEQENEIINEIDENEAGEGNEDLLNFEMEHSDGEVNDEMMYDKSEEDEQGEANDFEEAEDEEEDDDAMLRVSELDVAQHRLSISDYEHHQEHIDSMMASIIQTREEYCAFHDANPGFFHLVLEASDICDATEKLSDFATSCFKKFDNESSRRSMVGSHGGKNKIDEQNFVTERLRDFKNSAMLWSKGHDILSTHDHVERKPNYYKEVKPREILLEKPTCHSNLLDPTLPRPKITLKMKRVVELHEKQLKCSSNTKDC